MKTDALRAVFLEFFRRKKHQIFPSDTLVPDDTTVYFTSAGMNQFKPYFLGEKKDISRAASCQKCLRTGDLDKVGQTAYHHTFFEMLGNFSFGDYFKQETIELAWEFVTRSLNLKEKDIWVSVYQDDTQAFRVWKDQIGVAPSKIIRLGEESNFWPANAPLLGPDGPCGPCSEIFFDRGSDKGCCRKSCHPDCGCGRFVEVWNLVFTEFNRKGKNCLEPLPQKNIDTGMGLERMAAVLQGKASNFQIDILGPVVKEVREIVEKSCRHRKIAESSVNAIVDHARAATFAIADGVYPSNEGRGYVIRKIIRRALLKARELDNRQPFLFKLPTLFAELMGSSYPEIRQKQANISKIIRSEEEKYFSILKEGKIQIDFILSEIDKTTKKRFGSEDVFRLYDTYGLPLDVIKEFANARGVSVDEAEFKTLLKRQQERSRTKSMFDASIFKEGGFNLKEKSEFTGYGNLEVKSNILKLFAGNAEKKSVVKDEPALVILDRTPFYAEAGGQLADKGIIKTAGGELRVEKVFQVNEAIIHEGRVTSGKIIKGKATAVVDRKRRQALARAHTATHLLQAALRGVLGAHVCQQGSFVDEDRLRFDFTHFEALSKDTLALVEQRVNVFILQDDAVVKRFLSLKEAKAEGALAFFKDKYSQKVRVVSVGDYSKELCGGTHLTSTGLIGSFTILGEASISSGIRRIEAVVGEQAYIFFRNLRSQITEAATLLKCDPTQLKVSLEKFIEESKRYRQKALVLTKANLSSEVKAITARKKAIKGISFLAYSWKKEAGLILDDAVTRELVDQIKKELKEGFIFIIYTLSGRNNFICVASDGIIRKGLSCKDFVATFKEELGLKGGGKDNFVQGVISKVAPDFTRRLEDCFLKFTQKILD